MDVLMVMAALAFVLFALADFSNTYRAVRDFAREQDRREAELLRRTRIEIEA